MANYYHNDAIELADGRVLTFYEMSEEELAANDIVLVGPAKSEYNRLHPKQEEPTPANDVSETTSSTEEVEDIQQQTTTEEINDDLETHVDNYKTAKSNEHTGFNLDEEDGSLSFILPDYGYEKYVMDIANWQKQRISFGAEPGYYYFKVFFNFKTNYGLLGGLMMTIDNSDATGSLLASKNTAYGYLKTIRKYHKYENVTERILSLAKFAATLKDISLRTPWLFKSLSGLNTINSSYVNNFDKEKTIIIGLGQESVDSRLGTLIDLYKYACFDQINCKEIIPANLRKFEMSIMVYHIPLSQYHSKAMVDQDNAQNTGILPSLWRSISGQDTHHTTNLDFDGEVDAKTTNDESNFSNMMSFKLFTFLNCEIDVENANEYYLDGMTNEQAFQLGNNQLKIKYDRVYEHRMNEWAQMFFGSDGFYYNRGIPDIFNTSDENNIGASFNITPNTMSADATNAHAQRIQSIQKKWIGNLPSGKISILDYQKLLLGRYYAPIDTPVKKLFYAEPFNINERATVLTNNYTDWFNNMQGSKKQWFNNTFRR